MPMTLLLGLACLAGAIGLGWLLATSHSNAGAMAQRLASIEDVYAHDFGAEHGPALLPAPLTGSMRALHALGSRLSPSDVRARLQRQLDLAGNSGRWTPERVLAFKGIGLIAGALFGLLVGRHSPVLCILLVVAIGTAGLFIPDLLVYNAGLKRQARLQQQLPDALDMMTVCVEAGLGFDGALSQVARNTEGPMAAESARVLQEMQFGKSRIQALRALSERTTVPGLRMLTSALVQASELGIPVASVLREQANEMRIRRRQGAEEKAQKVTVKILFPLIFCLFPALLIIVVGPGALGIVKALSM
jgi:tight adherence protein C